MTDRPAIPSVSVNHAGTRSSARANSRGMRPLQERVFQKRGEHNTS
jgi:hypothetical protein